MPTSRYESTRSNGIAVTAQSLYLLNLLLIPGLGFVLMLALYLIKRKHCDAFTLNHLQQTVFASIWAAALIVLVNGVILLIGGYQNPMVWVVVILYFTTVHASFIFMGVFGLIKALAGQCWRYPVIGKALPSGCSND
jgi:uncharacterized Tic20 family protein